MVNIYEQNVNAEALELCDIREVKKLSAKRNFWILQRNVEALHCVHYAPLFYHRGVTWGGW